MYQLILSKSENFFQINYCNNKKIDIINEFYSSFPIHIIQAKEMMLTKR